MTVNLKQMQEAQANFFFAYGLAMAKWADVERGLYYWFAGIAGMKDGLCRAIFYGSRGFAARLEMLEGSIPFAERQTAEEIAFIREAIKAARRYSGFRNKIAHGEPIPIITDDGVIMSMGNAKDITDKSVEIKIDDLIAAATNFSDLASAIISAIPKNREGKPLSEYLSQVLQLPNEANSKNAQTDSAPAQPPQTDGRVNKRAFRAAQQAGKSQPKE